MAKGATSDIGAILALMMLIAASTGAYVWASKLQKTQESAIESTQSGFFTKVVDSCVSISAFSHNLLTNKSTVTLRNCGNIPIKVGDIAGDDSVLSSGPPQCAFVLSRDNCDICPFTLPNNELKTFKINWDVLPCQLTGTEEKEFLFKFNGAISAGVHFTPISSGTCREVKREIKINNTGSTVNGYQVNLTINTTVMVAGGNMSADCSNIVFKDSNDKDTMPHWIESGCNTTNTTIWVKVPRIEQGAKNIFMHYNTGQINSSNGSDTFIMFDDFLGNTINNTLWNISLGGTTATATVGNGALNLFANNGFSHLVSKVNFTTNASIEMRMLAENSTEERERIRFGSVSGITLSTIADAGIMSNGVAHQGLEVMWDTNGWTNAMAPERDYFRWVSIFNDTTFRWILGASNNSFYYSNSTGATFAPILNATVLVGESDSLIKGGNVTIDWIFVRRYFSPEPVMQSVGEETLICTE